MSATCEPSNRVGDRCVDHGLAFPQSFQLFGFRFVLDPVESRQMGEREHNLRRQYEKGGIDKMEIVYNQHLLNQITVTMELLLKYMKTGTYGGSAQKKSSAHKKIKKNLKKSRK